MSAPGAGVLLALSGDDAEILRALSQAGSGLCVVRRCADLPELLSAGMAGLAGFALLDTGFDEIDRTVLDRLARAGLSGMLLVEAHEEERWRSAGWPVLRRDTEPGRICAALQDLVRRGGASGAASTGAGPAAGSADWLSAATPASTEANTEPNAAAQETAWLEELWRQSPGSPEGGTAPSQPPRASNDAGGRKDMGQSRRRSWETAAADTPEPAPPVVASPAGDERGGRIVLVWGPHGAPGRSTVAASLAHGLAACSGAILVDADVEAPSLVQLLGMPEDSSALAGAARLATHGRLDAESFRGILAPAGGGLLLLGGLGRSGRWRELPPASMTEVWAQCRRAAAWTVVDVAGGPADDDVDDFTLEPGRGAVTADLVSHADVILVVGGADPAPRRDGGLHEPRGPGRGRHQPGAGLGRRTFSPAGSARGPGAFWRAGGHCAPARRRGNGRCLPAPGVHRPGAGARQRTGQGPQRTGRSDRSADRSGTQGRLSAPFPAVALQKARWAPGPQELRSPDRNRQKQEPLKRTQRRCQAPPPRRERGTGGR